MMLLLLLLLLSIDATDGALALVFPISIYPVFHLVSSFVSILKQITEHRLPRDFDYHRIPAPWVQMKLLRILSLLGRADQTASESMYEVLLDVMRRADTGAWPRLCSFFFPLAISRTFSPRHPLSAPPPRQASTSATPSSTSACAR